MPLQINTEMDRRLFGLPVSGSIDINQDLVGQPIVQAVQTLQNTGVPATRITAINPNTLAVGTDPHFGNQAAYVTVRDSIFGTGTGTLTTGLQSPVTITLQNAGTIGTVCTHYNSVLEYEDITGLVKTPSNKIRVCNEVEITPRNDDEELVFEHNGVEITLSSLKIKSRKSKKVLFQSMVYNNLSPKTKNRGKILTTASIAELKARETLREFITEDDWRRYVTNGFIMAKGQSGKWYQLFGDERVKVFEKGKLVCKLCIHSTGCPPTDHVLSMKTLVEFDEEAIWAGANIHELTKELQHLVPNVKKQHASTGLALETVWNTLNTYAVINGAYVV